MNQKEREKLYKETNDKFVDRVENMLYYICGCDTKRGREVLEECLKRNSKRDMIKGGKFKDLKLNLDSGEMFIDKKKNGKPKTKKI